MAGAARVIGVVLLGFSALFYLQFGLQAIVHSRVQAGLALLGAAALAWATVRLVRGRMATPVACLGTLPLFVFHLVVEVAALYPDESHVFVIAAAVAPSVSGMFWLAAVSRQRKHTSGSSST